MPKSCYIHIPFCSGKKCNYCSFISYNKPEMIANYIDSLIMEIKKNYCGEKLNTLYFGGGTPSLIPTDYISKIINLFSFETTPEITLEINPENGNIKYLNELFKTGVNRISIGAQTFDDKLLRLIGRKHSANDIKETIYNAKKAGFKNISVDLIYGLPLQTIQGIHDDINHFLELEIQHISTYGLKIEETSFWYKQTPENIPDSDTQADMIEFIIRLLEDNHFFRYEISNFSLPNFESRHNLNYWNNNEYYGFGAAAHGYINGVRYYNYSTLEKYIENPLRHEYSKKLSEQDKLEEEIFLGLRKTEGINIQKIKDNYNVNFKEKYKSILTKYKDYFIQTKNGYAFNDSGMILSNEILPYFI